MGFLAPVLDRENRCSAEIMTVPDRSGPLVDIKACAVLHHYILNVNVRWSEKAGGTTLRVENAETYVVRSHRNRGCAAIQ